LADSGIARHEGGLHHHAWQLTRTETQLLRCIVLRKTITILEDHLQFRNV